MSGKTTGAESWQAVYTAFQNINFTSFEYYSIKQSLIDYIKLYFPESFNDFIESSEFIAIVEAFAYVSELYAYRFDMNAHENFLPVAQLKQNVLRLAKAISYSASRNLPARGLVKITSVRTTESVVDSKGQTITNTKVIWNDLTNSDWKDQFITIFNKLSKYNYGSVPPTERVQVQDVVFELYDLNNTVLQNGVLTYSATVSGTTYPMELVSCGLNASGPYEVRPENGSTFSFVVGSDGAGDGSDYTGVFVYTKQGTLSKVTTAFDGVTPNTTFDIAVDNINQTDVWVNNVVSAGGAICDDGTSTEGRSGEWVPVDVSHAQNIIFNSSTVRGKYEIETLDNDNIRLVFGDGEFADIPSGVFEIWYRTSSNDEVTIPQSAVRENTASLTYVDDNGNNQTFTFTYSLIGSLQNSSASETIEHIRSMAPSVYYTQDRMVNGRDYNTYMLQDSTIMKLKTINRTFAGHSNYAGWYDTSATYGNVKLFGNDGNLYFSTYQNSTEDQPLSMTGVTLISNVVEPLLSNPAVYAYRMNVKNQSLAARKYFSSTELAQIAQVVDPVPATVVNWPVYLVFDNNTDVWTAKEYLQMTDGDYPIISISQEGGVWKVKYWCSETVFESPTTRFWNASGTTVVDYSTATASNDVISILTANMAPSRISCLTKPTDLVISGNRVYDIDVPEHGLINYTQVSVVPDDTNVDGYPDDVDLSNVLNFKASITQNAVPVGTVKIALPTNTTFKDPIQLTRPTPSYVDITLPFAYVSSSSTNLDTKLTYTVSISVNSDTVAVSIVGADAQTYAALIGALAAQLESQLTVVMLSVGTKTVIRLSSIVDSFVVISVQNDTLFSSLSPDAATYPVVVGSQVNGMPSAACFYGIKIGTASSTTEYTINGSQVVTYGDVIEKLFTQFKGLGFYYDNNAVIVYARDGVSPVIVESPSTPNILTVGTFDVQTRGVDSSSYVINLPSQVVVLTQRVKDSIRLFGNDSFEINPVQFANYITSTTPTSTTTSAFKVISFGAFTTLTLVVNDFVYFVRSTDATTGLSTPWQPIPTPTETDYLTFMAETSVGVNVGTTTKRELGRSGLNFLWMHHTPLYNLVDPSPTNIHDALVITKGYYQRMQQWMAGTLTNEPDAPTPYDLRNSYGYMLGSKMLSDSVVVRPGKFKVLFGTRAIPQLQGVFKVVRNSTSVVSDSQVKSTIISTVRNYFNIEQWEFGGTFYFTDLASQIHNALPNDIETVTLVPLYSSNYFGDLFQVTSMEDELFLPHITVDNIQIVDSLNRKVLKTINA